MYRKMNSRIRSQITLKSSVVVVVLLMMLLVIGSIQAQLTDPIFQNEILILEGWDIVLSPNEKYAAGSSRHVIASNLIEVRLWNLETADPIDGSALEPTTSAMLEYRVPPRMISSFEMQFSPDEQYLAVRKDIDLTIFTIPDFQIQAQVAVSKGESVDPGTLRWSTDGRFLATQGNGDLVVWDNQTAEINRHRLDQTWGPIIAVDDGWLVLRFMYDDRSLTKAFSFCTKRADECKTYVMEQLLQPYTNGQSVVASPDGQHVLTFGQGDNEQVGVWAWHRGSNEDYIRGDLPLVLDEDVFPLLFSPDGSYLITHGGEAVWDYKTLTQIQELNTAWDIIAFGQGNEHFVVLEFPNPLSNLRMYRVGQETPIDTFSILEHLDLDSIDPGIGGLKLTVGHDWILANLRKSGVLIPVAY